jgi:hypothetical protein
MSAYPEGVDSFCAFHQTLDSIPVHLKKHHQSNHEVHAEEAKVICLAESDTKEVTKIE